MSTRSVQSARLLIPLTAQKSMYFNGTNAKALVPITPSLTGFSIGFSILLPRPTGGVHYISNMGGARTYGFSFCSDTGANLIFCIGNGAPNYGNTINKIENSPLFNQWAHIVATWIPGSNNKKLYVNSVLHSQATVNSMTAGGNFHIGSRDDGAAQFARQYIKNFTFQNTTTPWTQDQINNLCFKNTIPSGAKQYGMNDVATDQDGANALTLTNTSYSTEAPVRPRSIITNRYLSRNMGTCLSFEDNTQMYIVRNNTVTTAYSPLSNYTFSFWTKLFRRATGGLNTYFGKQSSGVSGYRMTIDANNMYFQEVKSYGASLVSSPFRYNNLINKWTHIAVTHNADVQAISFFVNGLPYTTGFGAGSFWSTATANNTSGLTLGGVYGPESGKQLIDEFAIHNRVLTNQEIKDMCLNGKYYSPVLQWMMDDASGVSVTDSSGYGNNGTFAGASNPSWSTDVFLKSRLSI